MRAKIDEALTLIHTSAGIVGGMFVKGVLSQAALETTIHKLSKALTLLKDVQNDARNDRPRNHG